MLLHLETGPQNYVPQRRTHSESRILASIVMLVVVALQSLEPTHLDLPSVQEVQEVMGTVVKHVTDQKRRPETHFKDRICESHYS